MPNQYFKFKRFTIHQDQCAMKVGTLACILGAYAWHNQPVKKALDIGTGTGLLALMMAQQFPYALIDAVEIEYNAYLQAEANVCNSVWSNRIDIHYVDFLHFDKGHGYDLVITNPPFFEAHFKSRDNPTNLARHVYNLTLQNLLHKVREMLSPCGVFYIILPPFEMEKAELLAFDNGLYLHKKLDIYNYPEAPVKAKVCAFGLDNKKPLQENLIIKRRQDAYTKQFVQLLKPFYLYL